MVSNACASMKSPSSPSFSPPMSYIKWFVGPVQFIQTFSSTDKTSSSLFGWHWKANVESCDEIHNVQELKHLFVRAREHKEIDSDTLIEYSVRISWHRRQVTFRRLVLRAHIALEFTCSSTTLYWDAPDFLNAHDCQSYCIGYFRLLKLRFFVELIVGYDRSGQIHLHVFGWISLKSLDGVALHSSNHCQCPGTRVPTRRTPICIPQFFHRSVNVFIRTLSNDKFLKLSTVCQAPDGSLGGSSTPRILDPKRAQV